MSALYHPTCRRSRSHKIPAVATIVALLFSPAAGPVFVPSLRAQPAPVGANFKLDAGDLRFIFRQIQIAEAHAAGGQLFGPGPNQVNELRLPFGLRTVDGSYNHIQAGDEHFGAADQLFPRLTKADFRQAEAHTFDPDGPGPLIAGDSSSYEQKKGLVNDSQPRIISNLIVDQTIHNPAVAALADPFVALAERLGAADCPPGSSPRCTDTVFIPNIAPDAGLSAPFNSMFTFFGQFFDHGLDLTNKGGGTVFVPLQADDPLFVRGSATNFMVLTRATNADCDPASPDCIPDGVGDDPTTPQDESANDRQEATNQTTPFVDQNQTYTSHPSHQVFLREYTMNADGIAGTADDTRPSSTGRMIDGAGGNIGNWGEVKAQAAAMLGIALVDDDVHNVPLLATDPYGRFLRGPNGFPLMMMASGAVAEGNPNAPISTVGARKTGHAFLDDIAHAANPSNPSHDAALLAAHFVTGDGRGNENIALTAVHTVFHAEHNRLQGHIHTMIHSLLTTDEIADWHEQAAQPPAGSGWDYGERLFQAARFVTEMEYQHLVFEEFARKVSPSINEFIGDGINFQSDTNPAILAEFAHQTYRLGHSMLTETIARTAPDGTAYDIPLLAGFLNPREFNHNPDPIGPPLTAAQAAGAIFRGGTRQVANEIDEFVTEALRNNLLGLPLDLAVLNLSRGRSEGVAPLNAVRRELHTTYADPALVPYENWFDFYFALKHPESWVNFVAAYGTHPSIANATTVAAKRRAAELILDAGAPPAGTEVVPPDALDFVFSIGDWSSGTDGVTITGVDRIDLWVGGLAEKIAPFGGLLGPTFNFIFEHQLENLQNADRFYYLERLDGLNLLAQLEANSFVELIQRNTTLNGDAAADVFARPDFVFNLSAQRIPGETGCIPHPGGCATIDDPDTDDPATIEPTTDPDESFELVRLPNGTIRYAGPAHVIFNGRDGTFGDRIISSEGDDTLRGNGGNDIIEGGAGNDQHIGGDGDDILTDNFGEDVIKGGDGNDAISGGSGPFDLLQGNEGDDFIVGGNDLSEVFGGAGNDVIFTGAAGGESFGGAGDDWMEAGPQLDLIVGDENNQFQDNPAGGHDVLIGGKGDDDYDAEGGDDIMVGDVLGTERFEGMLGFDWVTYRGDALPVDADMNIRVVLPPNLDETRDRFDLAEALSGWDKDDILRGDDRVAAGDIAPGHVLTNAGIIRIDGLRQLLVALLGPTANSPAFTFDAGNIILGGLGSDVIEGRGGDDLIDGDVWLNAQLRAPNLATPDPLDTKLVDSLHDLKEEVFAGRINPGAITIYRSIVNSGSAGLDTARFSGPRADYTIAANAAGMVTVTDNVGDDGTDTLRNIEQLQFPVDNGPDGLPRTGDETVFLTVSTGNNPPTGAPILNQPLPQENQQLAVQNGNIADADGITAGSLTFQWQQGAPGGGFVNIAGATARQFTPLQAQVGQLLRAIISYTDGAGRLESVASAPSGEVGDVFVGTAAADAYTGTAGRDDVSGSGGNDTLTTGDAADVVAGQAGNDTLTTGAGDDIATGGGGDDVVNTGSGNDIVRFGENDGFDTVNGGAGVDEIRAQAPGVVIGLVALSEVEAITANGNNNVRIDGSAAANTLNFSAVILTGINSINGGAGGDNITGSGAADTINGQDGADVISGGPGADNITGGADADTLNGDGGADTIDGGAGIDQINGGAGTDIITGGGGADAINGGADNDTINGEAGNDAITGGAGNDNMAIAAANTLDNDVFIFAATFGADTISGFGATQSATVGQDRMDLRPLGITTATFGANVTIGGQGNTTTITIVGGGTITLTGVQPATITIADFIVVP